MVKSRRSIEIKNISINFREKKVFKNFSFKIKNNEIIAILGISGCGKTTLLNTISGVNQKYKGEIIKDGNIGYLFQEEKLLLWKTVKEQLKLCELIKNKSEDLQNKIILEILKELNIEENLNKYPFELSGGMKQRVEIARLIASNRNIWLMDELSSNLDIQIKHSIQKLIERLWIKNKKTIVLVTHDIDEALFLADRIIILGNQPTNIVKEIYNDNERPRKLKNLTSLNFNKLRKEIINALEEEYFKIIKLDKKI